MPLYCYRCDRCGHTWDDFKPVGSAVPGCPVCHAEPEVTHRDFKAENTWVQKPWCPMTDNKPIGKRRPAGTKRIVLGRSER